MKHFIIISSGGTIENELFWKGLDNSLEPETIWIWKLLSANAKIVIDIGANTGIYSLVAKAINPLCCVYSFEPSRTTYKALIKNIEINHFDIFPYPLAISNKNCESVFYDVFDEHQTSASLSPEKLKNNPFYDGAINEYLVKTTTIDNFIRENKINSVDLVKIDVELHEPEVFAGMTEVIENYKPFIIFEVLVSEVADKLNDFFLQKNYKLFHLESKNDSNYCLKNVEKLVGLINFDWNYFACPIEKLSQLNMIGAL